MAERIEVGARVYAEALYEAAVDAGRVREVDADMQAFVAGLVENRQLFRALLNPQLHRDAKQRVISSVLGSSDPLVRNATHLLADNGRLSWIPDMQLALSELAAVEERILDIEVTSAVPLG